MGYERPNITRLGAYTPGEQPLRNPGQRVIKLNTNENPYPPAPQVLEAVRGLDAESLRRYPPPTAQPFRELAAQTHGLTPQHVIATNGGDELLRLAITVFCEPVLAGTGSGGGSEGESRHGGQSGGGGLGMADPSYSLYPVLARIHDTPLTRVPLRDDFSLPGDFADRLNAAGCRLAMVVNPHAPSGRLEPLETLERMAQTFNGVLLVDEAYVDFAHRDAIPLLDPAKKLDNVLLLRSFSKGYSLAGVRFGYGLGHPSLIAVLDKARDSYNTSILSQTAATAALKARTQAAQTWQAVIDERIRLSTQLAQRGFSVCPSQSNFILVTPGPPPGNSPGSRPPGSAQGSTPDTTGNPTTQPTPAARMYESLKQQQIFVRYFNQDRLTNSLRITIGTPDENQALLDAIDKLLIA